MGKFCGKCGARLDEATGLCPNCDAEKLRTLVAQQETASLSKKEARKKRKAERKAAKKAARKAQKQQKKAAKKAAKKEKWAKLTFWQKTVKVLLRALLYALLLAVLLGVILGGLVYVGLVDIPVISDALDLFGITSEEDAGATQFKHLGAGFTDILVVDEASAVEAAKDAARKLGLDGAADELTVQSVNNVDGTTYYRMQQNYDGIPVVGKTMVVIADSSGNAVGFTTNAASVKTVEFGAAPDMETVLDNLTAYMNDHGYNLDQGNLTVENCTDDKRAYYETDTGILPVYVLSVFLNDSPLSFTTVTINAKTGEVVALSSTIYEGSAAVYNASRTIAVDGNFDESSGEYQLYDVNRGIWIYSYNNTDSTSGNATQTFITSPNELFGDEQSEIALEQEKGIQLMSNVAQIHDYYVDVMNWNGYGQTYCYYNDAFDSGRNALGGNGTMPSGEIVGYLSMGSVTGVNALDTLAHEYTHIVSRKVVDWQDVEAWSEIPDEAGAINEGYSDIFGELLESYLTQTAPDWVHGDRVLHNPMSNNYPGAVGDKKFVKFGQKWGMSVGGGMYSDYSHGFSTIISHCAYLMNNGVNNSCEPIDLYTLARLWYNTLQTLPSNCTFVVLRENMELTAEILGFTQAQKNCIAAAFDEVGIVKQETGEETYSTESTLLVLDKNGEAYGDCAIRISGKKFRGIFKTGMWKEDYSQEIEVTGTEPVPLDLPKGDYVITVTDNADETLTRRKHIKARPDGKLTEIIMATNFGGDTVVQVPIRTTSDERDIVLVLDRSGSMWGTPLTETKKASINFIDTILDQDASIGIVAYDNDASMLSDFSVDEAALTAAVSNIYDGGGTNIEDGLAMAREMLHTSNAKKKIIVLMSDGEPNDGREGDDLIAYADEIKAEGVIIYTLGFFESLGSNRSSAQLLMEGIASDGCHYEVANADDLVFFFEDVADQINGQKYIYIRIACPVDVSVSYHGQTLDSSRDGLSQRTDFGTLTYEENENAHADSDDRIKILRLKEGADYDVQIVGTGRGVMDYTIGFMDEDGQYSDLREFENIKITRSTVIDTEAKVSRETVLKVDEDGDGKYDIKYRARENGYGEEMGSDLMIFVCIGAASAAILLVVSLPFKLLRRKRR